MANPIVHCLFHESTNTCVFIVSDKDTKKCAVIDSAIDFDFASGNYNFGHADKVIQHIKENNLIPEWILETHVHADHLTAAAHIHKAFPDAKLAIGSNITVVQRHFKKVFNLPEDFPCDGSQFTHLFGDNEEFNIGKVKCKALHTPGHTPDSMSYLIGDCVFCGDTVFMPDYGTARCDFPNGSPTQLYHAIKRLYQLPDSTRLFVGHDYSPGGRPVQWETTVGKEKKENKMIREETTEDEFVNTRSARDATLSAPRLMLASLQVNLRAGQLPEAESNGVSYLKIPLSFQQ